MVSKVGSHKGSGGVLLVVRSGVLVAMLLVFVGPILYAVMVAFQPSAVIIRGHPTWVFSPTFVNVRSLFTTYDFARYTVNSVVTSVVSSMAALVIGVPAGYALNRVQFRGRWTLLIGLMVSRALPAVGVAVPFFVMFSVVHLINTDWALVLAYLPYDLALVTWLTNAYLRSVPRALDEAAAIDGAGRVRTLVTVVAPVASPGLVSAGLFCFFFGWNNFVFPLVLTQQAAATIPVALTTFVGEYTVNWGGVMAGVVVLSAPVVVGGLFLQRHMVSGLGSGAVRE